MDGIILLAYCCGVPMTFGAVMAIDDTFNVEANLVICFLWPLTVPAFFCWATGYLMVKIFKKVIGYAK